MKRPVITLLVILLVSASGYATYFWIATESQRAFPPAHEQSALSWIEQEFDLSPDARKSIATSHAAYLPKCQDASAQLLAARKKLTEWPAGTLPTARELKDAHLEVLRIEGECFAMAVAHIDEIADLMDRSEGPRYRKIMLNKLMTLESREHLPIGELLKTEPTKP